MLFFRDQPITADQQLAFARAFGSPPPPIRCTPARGDHPEIYSVETAQLKGSPGATPDASRALRPRRSTQTGWHTDITFVPNPAMGSILRGVVIPPYGGDTLWTNLVAAYEDLSAPIRDLIDGLQAVHRWHDYDGLAKRDDHDPARAAPVGRAPGGAGPPGDGGAGPVRQPHLHPLPRRASTTARTARSSICCTPRWPDPSSRSGSGGSPTAWPSGTTGPPPMSARSTWPPADFDRTVERVTMVGDVPVGPDGFRSQALTGDLFA